MNRLKSTLTILAAAATVSAPRRSWPSKRPHQPARDGQRRPRRRTGDGRLRAALREVAQGRPARAKSGAAWCPSARSGARARTRRRCSSRRSRSTVGDTTIPAGAYTLFTAAQGRRHGQLIVSKQIGQWGETYDEKQDLARIDLKKETLDAPVDQFTMTHHEGRGGQRGLMMKSPGRTRGIPCR